MFLWLKALHLIFVVCWFAGIFYLPRLFVNYAIATNDDSRQQLAQMCRKLYRFMTPLAVLAVGFGVWLAALNWQAYATAGWLHAKLTLVVVLIAYHLWCGRISARLQRGENNRSHVFYRWFNEIPVLLLFAIVILAVVRPF